MYNPKFYLLTNEKGELVEWKVKGMIRALKFLLPIVLIASLIGLYKFNEWNKSFHVSFQWPWRNFLIISPVPQSQFQVNLAPQSEIEKISERLFPKAKAAELPKELTKTQYIVQVFGKKEAFTAIAIAKAESGLRCDAQGINKGTNSLDAGLFQINSVHLRKGWKVTDLMNCKKNTDHAYEIFQSSGWGAWSTYKNGAYKAQLPEARQIVESNS